MKDTVINLLQNVSTRHEIRLAGAYDEKQIANFQDVAESASDVEDAVLMLEDEGARIMEYAGKGVQLSCDIEWENSRQAKKKPFGLNDTEVGMVHRS